MRMLMKFAILGALAYVAKRAWDYYMGAPTQSHSRLPAPGHDTATGTDPNAKYSVAGYEDKSLGQAVNDDMELVDRLMDETGGDAARAEARFNTESAGAPALERQRTRDSSS